MIKHLDGDYLGFCDFSVTILNHSRHTYHNVIIIKPWEGLDDKDTLYEVAVSEPFANTLRTVFGTKGGYLLSKAELVKDINGNEIYVMTDLNTLRRESEVL